MITSLSDPVPVYGPPGPPHFGTANPSESSATRWAMCLGIPHGILASLLVVALLLLLLLLVVVVVLALFFSGPRASRARRTAVAGQDHWRPDLQQSKREKRAKLPECTRASSARKQPNALRACWWWWFRKRNIARPWN